MVLINIEAAFSKIKTRYLILVILTWLTIFESQKFALNQEALLLRFKNKLDFAFTKYMVICEVTQVSLLI